MTAILDMLSSFFIISDIGVELVLNSSHSDMGVLKRPIPALSDGSSILTFPQYSHYFVPYIYASG